MRNTIQCKCGGSTDVVNSRYRESTNEIRRRRECLLCKNRYTTVETIAYEGMQTHGTPTAPPNTDMGKVADARIKSMLAKIRKGTA